MAQKRRRAPEQSSSSPLMCEKVMVFARLHIFNSIERQTALSIQTRQAERSLLYSDFAATHLKFSDDQGAAYIRE
jgi:hypothetical protein